MASNNMAKGKQDEKNQDRTSTTPTKGSANGAAGKEDTKSPPKKRRKVNHGQYEMGESGQDLLADDISDQHAYTAEDRYAFPCWHEAIRNSAMCFIRRV